MEAIEELLKLDEYYGWKRTESSVSYLFEKNGGLDGLETLQKHPNKVIYDQAVRILTTYFEEENED